MEIALVIPYNPLEEIGGLELGTVRHAQALVGMGNSVAILTLGESGQAASGKGVAVPVLGFRSFPQLCSYLSSKPIPVVHWMEIFPGPGEVAMQATVSSRVRAQGRKVVFMVATSGNLRSRGSGPGVTPLMQEAADCWIVSNPDQVREFAECGLTENIHLIGFGVDAKEQFVPVNSETKAGLRTQLSLPPQENLFLFMGRFVERKRPDLLLKVWRSLTRIHFDSSLIVVGSGMGQHDSIEERLHGEGLISGTPKLQLRDTASAPHQFYQACDVLLLPSSREGQPNVLMEMMACGGAVIGSDIPGIRELLEDGVTGLTFPVDDEAAFSEAIIRLADDKKYREQLGCNGRRKIAEEKDVRKVTEKYLELYRLL